MSEYLTDNLFSTFRHTQASQLNKALIRRRRIRGAAGSFIEFPQVIGLHGNEPDGSISTSPSYSPGTVAVSESDLHQIFAEAIVAGHPEPGEDAELITGIARLSSRELRQIPWAGDP